MYIAIKMKKVSDTVNLCEDVKVVFIVLFFFQLICLKFFLIGSKKVWFLSSSYIILSRTDSA